MTESEYKRIVNIYANGFNYGVMLNGRVIEAYVEKPDHECIDFLKVITEERGKV